MPNLPNGVPLKLPNLGDVVQVAFPTRAWQGLTIQREWRKPRDVGNGFYEHP